MTATPNPRDIAIADYIYELPDTRIAGYPLADRDASNLLVYANGNITQTIYRHLAGSIPEDYLLVFNKTKVVEARLFFTKPTGGIVEIFCLEPGPAYPDMTTAMGQTGWVIWTCLVGGAAKWKPGQALENTKTLPEGQLTLKATVESKQLSTFSIKLEWSPTLLSFAEILHHFGVIPIPPYLNRPTESTDAERYQTIYAKQDGSVAAPTAGLHFTEQVFDDLQKKGIPSAFVTLHVGAGTFKPVKTQKIADHEMHAELMDVDRNTIIALMAAEQKIIAVGTTSLRTLESLYWMGVKAAIYPEKKMEELEIGQWEVYDELLAQALPVSEALQSLLDRMNGQSLSRIICKTQIMITPGYPIKMVKALITNFHQPGSTLLLLVAALVGNSWRKVYQYALDHEFRFLSYGDGSLLWYDHA